MQSDKTDKKATLKELLGIVAPFFRQHKLRIAFGLTALIIVDFLQLMIPRILQRGVDGLTENNIDQPDLLQLGMIIIAIACTVAILRFCWRYMIIGFSRMLECWVRDGLFKHILKMDALFFEKNSTGKLMSHSSNDLSAIQMAFGMGTIAAVDSTVMLTAAVGFMLFINVKLTLIALLPMPFLAISTRILSGKLHHRFETVQEQFSHLTEFSRSTVSSIRLVKAYTMEDLQVSRFDELGKKYVKANLRVALINGLMHPVSTLVGNLGMLLVFFFGGRMVIEGTITLGNFVAFITYLYMLIWPMMAIGWVANLVQRGLTSLGRIYKLLIQQSTLNSKNTSNTAEELKAHIDITNLTFTYPSGTSPALTSFTHSFTEGIYGITGRTGSGKTSLCRLICRLYPVPNNTLRLGNKDVNELTIDKTRGMISYVSQEPVLFSDSVKSNILLGDSDADQLAIEAAAKKAAIHDEIMALPKGYDTVIGEKGVKLSGGQRQRLALARALLADRAILLIDDGLSAVDVETEHQIFSHLRENINSKVTIIVSNRIKLLSMTDKILVLRDGLIDSKGSHTDLLQANTLYQSMSEKQNSLEGAER